MPKTTLNPLRAAQLRKACQWAMDTIQNAGLDLRSERHKQHLNALEAVADRAEDVAELRDRARKAQEWIEALSRGERLKYTPDR